MESRESLELALNLIEAAAKAYDAGDRRSVKNLVIPIRSIFHDSTQSPSLLTQLHTRFIDLLSTVVKRPGNITSGFWSGIISWDFDVPMMMFLPQPRLGAGKSAHRPVAFKFWWESEAIYQFGEKKVKRRDLILACADQPGDPKLPSDYLWVVGDSAWKMTIKPDPVKPQREIILPFAHFAAIRQIAHEVLHSQALLKLAGR